MAQSQLSLYNLAISLLGGDYSIGTVNEQSIPAETLNLWYENVRQVLLRSAHWNSCRRYTRLTQEAVRDFSVAWAVGAPEPGFAYSYEWPTGMLAARYLTSFDEFSIGYDDDSQVLNCNLGGTATEDKPVLCYTIDQTDPAKWEPDLYQAMAWALGAVVSIPLSGRKGTNAMVQMANSIILSARANSANEMLRFFQRRPTVLGERGYSYPVPVPFIYPYGALFSAQGTT